MSLDLDGFTKTQLRILKVLADGEPHLRSELEGCLSGSLGTSFHKHLLAMRKLLRPQGQLILCVVRHRQYHYCWVQLCPFAYKAFFQGNSQEVPSKV